MKNENIPTNYEIPSTGKLIKSTIVAILIAAFLLFTVILPAEYGIDPLGAGKILGLTKMGEIKQSLAREAEVQSSISVPEIESAQTNSSGQLSQAAETDENPITRKDSFTFSLEPDKGKEIKLTMTKGSSVTFAWQTDGGIANFDMHADSKKHQIKYHNYEKGKLEKSEGTLEAAFDGNHGWFWRNRTTSPLKITLDVFGSYSDVLEY